MATGNTQINGSDPTVLRQQERQTAAALTRSVSAPATVSPTTGGATSNVSNTIRTLAPVVSGNDILYPQSTTATSNSAVTISSSVNNDSGDVTTVYSTNGAITVNPINQTINQYTSVDSGVSQIVAGNGVTITSTGGSGTGVVTINSSTVALGNIVSVNLDGNSANVLHGDGSWSADQTTYGNSNVAAYLPTYTGNIGGNVVTANLFAGNGSSLSAIAGANVSGFVPNANVANTAFAVAGANVSGFVPNANVANTAFAVAAANVTGLGNIATINLTGSNANVLYGNGVFAAVAGGANTGNVTFDDVTVQGVNGLNLSAGADFTANLAYLQVRAGDVPSHIHLDTGNNEAYDLIVGDDQNYVQVSSTGNILLSSYDSNTAQYIWTLDYNGNLILAGGNSVIQSIANSSLDPTLPNVSTMVLTPDANYNSQVLVLDPTAPGHIHLRAYAFSNIDEPAANIFLGGEDTAFEVTSGANNQAVIHSNGKAWTFGNDGNISSDTLTFTTTFANVKTVEYQTAGVWDLYVEDGITGSNTAISRLNVSFKDNLIDKPQVYIENTKENDGIALRWTFDENGNLNFPRDVAGNSDPYLSIFGGSTPTIQSTDVSLAGPANLAISADYLNLSGFSGDKIVFYADTGEMATDANMTLTTNLANTGNTSSWTFSDDGLLTLPGGNVVIGSLLGSEAILASNIAFGVVSQGNGSTVLQWIDDVSNASALSAIYINSPSGNTGDVVVLTGEPGANANIWTFGNDGVLTVPGNLVYIGASPAPSINGFGSANFAGAVTAANITLPNSSVLTFGDTPVTNRYYIDATRTDTYTQNGSQARPFKTIAGAQAAIATAIGGGLNPEVEPIYMILLSNITEDVTLATNHVYLIGQNGQIHQPIILSGNITVNPTSGTLGSNHFSISGLEIVGGTNGKAIYVTGTSPLRLSLQDVWITANGTGAGLYQDNTGTGTYTHGGPLKVSHNGSGDVYCFDIRKGTASFDTVETSGATQVGAAGAGATLTFNNSQLDANGDVVVETYGNGVLVVTNSVIKNSQANGFGVKLNAVANVAGTVSIGQSAFNVPTGTGSAVWLDPNTTAGLSGVFAWSGTSFYPSTNTTISPTLIPGPLATLVGTQINPIFYGDITSYALAQDWDLIDNNASALSFDTTGKAGILNLVTTNSSEGVTMSGYANVTGNVTGGNISTAGIVKMGVFATGNIPAAATAGAGAKVFVTDATANTFGTAYVGGASNAVPVWSDGSAWYIG